MYPSYAYRFRSTWVTKNNEVYVTSYLFACIAFRTINDEAEKCLTLFSNFVSQIKVKWIYNKKKYPWNYFVLKSWTRDNLKRFSAWIHQRTYYVYIHVLTRVMWSTLTVFKSFHQRCDDSIVLNSTHIQKLYTELSTLPHVFFCRCYSHPGENSLYKTIRAHSGANSIYYTIRTRVWIVYMALFTPGSL